VHDFLIKELGRAVPYGIYDLAANAGFRGLPGMLTLQMRNHRLGARGAGLEFASRRTISEQRRLEHVDVVGRRWLPRDNLDERISRARAEGRA
jgi:hypothetical protein